MTRLFRIILQVGEMDRAEAFYATLLGDAGRRVHGNRHYFDCGETILALLDPGASARPIPDHVYFAVEDLEVRHARAQKLEALSSEEVHGAPAGDIVTRPWGERSFYAVDPWGNKLCFVDAATVFTGL
jgi:catechol 2,3-dioxygenase-like lactoylglutathione lyase family enzyme